MHAFHGLIFALIIVSSFAMPSWVKNQVSGGSCSAKRGREEASLLPPAPTVTSGLFDQLLDHYNHQDLRTWKQRYWVNTAHWDGKGPIFLQLGGEGPASSYYVTGFAMDRYASQYQALEVALEHRFYGSSQPFPATNGGLSTDNLNYLSAQQALADAADFIVWIKEQYNATDSQIVTFGCSYSGALAAFFRTKYPHITLASVASSAPVQAVVDFYQYLNVVDQSLSYFVGRKCDERIAAATQQIQTLLKSGPAGQQQIKDKFKVCKPFAGQNDIATFMSNLMGNWQGLVQYNLEGAGPTVTDMCNKLTSNPGSDLQAYADVSNFFLALNGETCNDASYTGMVAELTNNNEFQSGMRQWIYQTCTEFGYFQTTDSDDDVQPFGDMVPVDYYIELCKDAYGKDFDVYARINATNRYYGGNQIPAWGPSNILFVNGNIDPWHSLSIFEKDISPTLNTIFINGTAHCANTQPWMTGDPPAIKDAQTKISAQIGKWLSAVRK